MVGRRTLDIPQSQELVGNFLKSRRQGLSLKTIGFYNGYLNWAILVDESLDFSELVVHQLLLARFLTVLESPLSPEGKYPKCVGYAMVLSMSRELLMNGMLEGGS